MKKVLAKVCLSLLVLGVIACSTEEPISTSGTLAIQPPISGISIETLSTKPWLVSAGNVLLEITIDPNLINVPVIVTVNGDDVSDQFINVSSTARQALLNNLPLGDSIVTAKLGPNGVPEQITLTNYPRFGPIISGPHESPYACQTT